MILDFGGVYMLWSFCLFISSKSALSGWCVCVLKRLQTW